MELLTYVLLVGIPFLLTLAVLFLRSRTTKAEAPAQLEVEEEEIRPAAQKDKKAGKTKAHVPTNPLFASSFKGFLGPVSDFDVQPGYLSACCSVRLTQDGRIRLYAFSHILDPDMKYLQTKMEGEPTAIAVSPTGCGLNSDSIVCANNVDLRINFFTVQVKAGTKSLILSHKFQNKHFRTIKCLGMTTSFVVSCAEEGDTEVVFWNYEGEILKVYDTNQVKNRMMAISRDFRLLSVAAWLSDARIVEIQCEKNSTTFKGIKSVMSLKGHTQGLLSVAFDETGSFAVSSSKDGSIRLWKTDVRYDVSEDPRLIKAINLPSDFPTADVVAVGTHSIALANQGSISFRDKTTGEVLDSIPEAHAGDIGKMAYLREGETEYLLTSANDAKVHVWSVPGHR